jgi:hypothetical protein
MPDLVRRAVRPPTRPDPLVAAARSYRAAQVDIANDPFHYDSWQKEAWHYWRTMGEVWYGLDWRSRAISRVRLTAAEMVPGGEEPEMLDTGPAAELVESFYGGIAGQSAFLRSIATHTDVPGEGWLVAERYDPTIPLPLADWSVQSTESFRPRTFGGERIFELRVDEQSWRPLLPDNLPVRIWEPDAQFPWRAFSTMQPALPICRRIELLDKQLIARLLSRLALNGILLIPQEGTIPVPEEFADAPDPFIAMLIDIAARNIANPGSASAAIPIPITYQSELIEKWRWLTFADQIDEHLLTEREGELDRLATTLNLSKERLTGMGDLNHWGISELDEGEVKTSIAPTVETIVGGLTKGYLQPMLAVSGESLVGPSGGKLIVWYDTSELTAAPDKSKVTIELYDRGEASGAAARREAGLDESDAMTPTELADWGWKRLVGTVELGPTAIAELSGQPAPGAGVSGPAGEPAPPAPTAPAPGTPPDTREDQAPSDTTPPEQQAAALSRLLRTTGDIAGRQARAARALEQLAEEQGRIAVGVAAGQHRATRNGNGKHTAKHRR